MDFLYHAKQLVHEIGILEAQIREKKAALERIAPSLTHQEKLLIDSPSMLPAEASPEGKPAAPKQKKKES